ncbi:hypothetical protein WG947_14215 [Pontibacter sp. H259]|uniref:hypothetical protein n=1 Tax=Pontibacter sp. H259 TaxID=3133421 RepID=UPI0030C28066
MKLKHILILATVALVLWFVYDSFSQPGPDDLKGNFKEVAFYRNENNTGPIVRVYAVTVSDTLWTEMQQYGEFMPHTKYGNTKVYFFLEGSPAPDKVTAAMPNIFTHYQPYCIGKYEKDAMSGTTFMRFPFRK